MNDEFLHALRRDPPPEFARKLQRRLQRQSARRSARSSVVRTVLGVLLIGGAAMAAAFLFRDRDETPREYPPITQAEAPRPRARATQPAGTPVPDRQVSGDVASQPVAEQPRAKDIPITLVTSSLTRPLAQALVERLSKHGYFAQPRFGYAPGDGAFGSLCGGHSDFVMASRRIADAELAPCHKWGIAVVEWKLGYQAVVLAAGPTVQPAALGPREVFLALARRIPDPADPARLIDNPNVTWHDVDARLDDRNIDVLATPDATTRELFMQLVMERGCEAVPSIRSLRQTDLKLYNDVCHQLRSDGRYREVELSETLIAQQLRAQASALLVLGYSQYAAHRTELSSMLEGPAPTLAALSDGTYQAARPVYVYAQRSHLDWNPAARLLAYQLTEESAVGPQGYLLRHGLVPLDEVPRRTQEVRPSLPPTLESLQPSEEHPK